VAEHGWLDEDGQPPAFVKVYFSALNSARLALRQLEQNLVEQGKAKGDALRAYLAAHYDQENGR
jgi:hypothetical protein